MLQDQQKFSELADDLKKLANKLKETQSSVQRRELLREFRIALKRADRIVLEQSSNE